MDLLDHQVRGARFLAARSSALLSDEMGLGKTAQAIAALRLLGPTGSQPAVLVCPSFLMANWQREFSLWAPEIPIRLVTGDAADRFYTNLLPVPVRIMSYESLRSHVGPQSERN